MTLQQLRYIIKIVECGSITEAAKQLYISQPSLSGALKDLESDIGIEIFSRNAKGISLTTDGAEFLSYARQVTEQADLLEQHYKEKSPAKKLCSISTQHYSFAVDAFVSTVSMFNADEYDLTLRETRTYEIIDDVRNFSSEIGILYINDFNEKVLTKLFKENHLVFTPVFTAEPHIFVSNKNPLANNSSITLEQLEDFPCLCFEQGEKNSFYFSEEILSVVPHKRTIHVSDRATLFSFLIGLNGYTISTGVINNDLNSEKIISVPLDTKEHITVGWIQNEKAVLGEFSQKYLDELKRLCSL